ncbi:MAG: hypothetical protein IJ134_05050 [Bacilli bacterium]|nr:hypothetical protein [Bacilli bacterium]
MIKIIKEEIEIDESLVSRLNVICDFCNTTPIIENDIMDEKEYTSFINKKEKNCDDFER